MMAVKSIKKICGKALGGLLAAVLVFTNIFSLRAFASDAGNDPVPVEPAKELTGLNITFLNDPVPGEALDMTAVVVSDQGIFWEIPVIWTDMNGNLVYMAATGEKYLPVFVFYMPVGYTIAGTGEDGSFSVKLPYYVTNLYGTEGLVFISDPALRIMYITYGLEYRKTDTQTMIAAAWAEEQERMADAAAREAEQAATRVRSNSHSSSSATSDADDDDVYRDFFNYETDGPLPEAEDEPQPEADGIPEQVRIHCSEKLIGMVDAETLEWLVDLVKKKLEPQAVNLLMEGFPAFAEADDNELSDETGLFIYMGADTMNEGYVTPANACAFYATLCSYDEEEFLQANILAIDASCVLQYDDQSETWILTDSPETKAMLDNTIVHEMMHGFMYDYNRTLLWDEDKPTWFVEGIASCVDNSYQYRANDLIRLYEGDEACAPYTDQSILDGFKGSPDYFRLVQEGSYADYVSGYLATAYLGYMEYSYMQSQGEMPAGEVIDLNGNVDTDKIRFGLNNVIKKLHENEPLDDIIREASGYSAQNPQIGYSSTADFRDNFVWNYETEYVDENSMYFCNTFLNYLESCSSAEMPAHGSLLFSYQQYITPLRWETEAEASKYNVADSGSFVLSSVDAATAANTAGVSEPGGYQKMTDNALDDYPEEDASDQDLTGEQETPYAFSEDEDYPEDTEINMAARESEEESDSANESPELCEETDDDAAENEAVENEALENDESSDSDENDETTETDEAADSEDSDLAGSESAESEENTEEAQL